MGNASAVYPLWRWGRDGRRCRDRPQARSDARERAPRQHSVHKCSCSYTSEPDQQEGAISLHRLACRIRDWLAGRSFSAKEEVEVLGRECSSGRLVWQIDIKLNLLLSNPFLPRPVQGLCKASLAAQQVEPRVIPATVIMDAYQVWHSDFVCMPLRAAEQTVLAPLSPDYMLHPSSPPFPPPGSPPPAQVTSALALHLAHKQWLCASLFEQNSS